MVKNKKRKEETQFKSTCVFYLSSKRDIQTLEMQSPDKDKSSVLCLCKPEHNWHLASCPVC